MRYDRDIQITAILTGWLLVAACIGITNAINNVAKEIQQSNKIATFQAECTERAAIEVSSMTAILKTWEITIEQNIK
jgi:hypothetical protein